MILNSLSLELFTPRWSQPSGAGATNGSLAPQKSIVMGAGCLMENPPPKKDENWGTPMDWTPPCSKTKPLFALLTLCDTVDSWDDAQSNASCKLSRILAFWWPRWKWHFLRSSNHRRCRRRGSRFRCATKTLESNTPWLHGSLCAIAMSHEVPISEYCKLLSDVIYDSAVWRALWVWPNIPSQTRTGVSHHVLA